MPMRDFASGATPCAGSTRNAGSGRRNFGVDFIRRNLDDRLVFGDLVARHHLVIDEEATRLHLDAVAGQADEALDVVGLAVARQLEDDDVAALRLVPDDAARP